MAAGSVPSVGSGNGNLGNVSGIFDQFKNFTNGLFQQAADQQMYKAMMETLFKGLDSIMGR
jgi:hypothetical protein